MKKLDKDLYIKHAKRLGTIIDEKSTFVPFLKRKDFSEVVKTQINVLASCEKLFPKVELDAKLTSKALAKNFNNITKETYKVSEFKYEDQTDLIDSINYLFTFCNNMFKVNLDDLVAGKKITATDPKIDLRAKAQFDDEAPRMNSNFAFAGGGIPLAATPYENPYLVGKAYAKLQDDMAQGKFYRFKTKPRIIPIMKWLSAILLMLLSLGLIVMGVFAFLAMNYQVTDSSTTAGLPGAMGSGIIYIILALFSIYPLYIFMKTLVGKYSKDENNKYLYVWWPVVTTAVLSLLIVLLDLPRTWCLPWTPLPSESSAIAIFGFEGWKIMVIIICAIIGLNIIPVVIGAVNNPKPDVEKVEAKIKEYIDLFTAESGQMPVPPKADVQKPTKVETPKKPSKDKDDKKSKK